MSAERVIEIARGELGYTEDPPGSNLTKFGQIYGWDGIPWCCTFLYAIFKAAGEGSAFFGGAKTASCGTLLRWYQAQGLTVPVAESKPGDIVILNFKGTKDTQHCGLVTENLRNGKIKTIEGNTSSAGSQDNGGMVCEKTRYLTQVVGVCRPEYKEKEMPKTDYDKHWAAKDIEWGKAQGYVKGYPDGTFHPDEAITRAENIVIIRRVVEPLVAEIAELKAEIAELKGGKV